MVNPPYCLPRSTLHHPRGGADHLGLVPLALGVEDLSLMAGNQSSFLHTPCKWLFVGFDDFYLKIIFKFLVFFLATMFAHYMFEKC